MLEWMRTQSRQLGKGGVVTQAPVLGIDSPFTFGEQPFEIRLGERVEIEQTNGLEFHSLSHLTKQLGAQVPFLKSNGRPERNGQAGANTKELFTTFDAFGVAS